MIKDHDLQVGNVQEFITFCLLNCANSMQFFDGPTSETQKSIKIDICVKLFRSHIFLNIYL